MQNDMLFLVLLERIEICSEILKQYKVLKIQQKSNCSTSFYLVYRQSCLVYLHNDIVPFKTYHNVRKFANHHKLQYLFKH